MDLAAEVGMRIRPLIGKASPLFYLCAFVFVASLILGGGTRGGFLSDAILQLLSLPLLIAASYRMSDVELTWPIRTALIFASAIAALPLIQLNADGCAIDVYPGNVLAVPAKCYQPMRAGLETPCDPNDPKSLCPPVAHGPYWLYGAVAAGIAVGICAASGCFREEHHHPKSP
jgi:hypothetical protein